jgi:hypothetical protein
VTQSDQRGRRPLDALDCARLRPSLGRWCAAYSDLPDDADPALRLEVLTMLYHFAHIEVLALMNRPAPSLPVMPQPVQTE